MRVIFSSTFSSSLFDDYTSQKIGYRINKLSANIWVCLSICRSERKLQFQSKVRMHISFCRSLALEVLSPLEWKIVCAVKASKHPSNCSKQHSTTITSSIHHLLFLVPTTTLIQWQTQCYSHCSLHPSPSVPCPPLHYDRLRTTLVSTADRGSTDAVRPPHYTSNYYIEMKAK